VWSVVVVPRDWQLCHPCVCLAVRSDVSLCRFVNISFIGWYNVTGVMKVCLVCVTKLVVFYY
jgi:hypothetical protein